MAQIVESFEMAAKYFDFLQEVFSGSLNFEASVMADSQEEGKQPIDFLYQSRRDSILELHGPGGKGPHFHYSVFPEKKGTTIKVFFFNHFLPLPFIARN